MYLQINFIYNKYQKKYYIHLILHNNLQDNTSQGSPGNVHNCKDGSGDNHDDGGHARDDDDDRYNDRGDGDHSDSTLLDSSYCYFLLIHSQQTM